MAKFLYLVWGTADCDFCVGRIGGALKEGKQAMLWVIPETWIIPGFIVGLMLGVGIGFFFGMWASAPVTAPMSGCLFSCMVP